MFISSRMWGQNSPECLTIDPIPSLTTIATLLTALLTQLLPLNGLQMIQFLLLQLLYCYSTLTLLTLLLPLNALQIIQFLLLRLQILFVPTNYTAFNECLTNDPIPSLTTTATLLLALLTASPECLTMIQFSLFQLLLL
jgi:hypothetical protein